MVFYAFQGLLCGSCRQQQGSHHHEGHHQVSRQALCCTATCTAVRALVRFRAVLGACSHVSNCLRVHCIACQMPSSCRTTSGGQQRPPALQPDALPCLYCSPTLHCRAYHTALLAVDTNTDSHCKAVRIEAGVSAFTSVSCVLHAACCACCRLRYGCTSANASIVVAAALKRPDWLPGSSSGLQEFRVEDVDFQV